jgi:hypothetical protein
VEVFSAGLEPARRRRFGVSRRVDDFVVMSWPVLALALYLLQAFGLWRGVP